MAPAYGCDRDGNAFFTGSCWLCSSWLRGRCSGNKFADVSPTVVVCSSVTNYDGIYKLQLDIRSTIKVVNIAVKSIGAIVECDYVAHDMLNLHVYHVSVAETLNILKANEFLEVAGDRLHLVRFVGGDGSLELTYKR
jgi:hypothetical protein